MGKAITFVPINMWISEPFVQNVMIIMFYKTLFIFVASWSFCYVSNILSVHWKVLNTAPEGMCSLPQSNVKEHIGHTLKKASQASQTHIVARGRHELLTARFLSCFPDARLSIGYQPMWCGECNLLLHSDCWFKNRLLNISYSLELWGRLP